MGGRFWGLMAKLSLFKISVWAPDSAAEVTDRGEVADLTDAHVVSSLIKDTVAEPGTTGISVDELFGLKAAGGLHHVVVDIDQPAWLVESSTPGHSHLYVELPGGTPWADYVEFLEAAAKIGLVEPGYVEASKVRGGTYVRLPWIRKGSTATLSDPNPPQANPATLPF